MSLISLDISNLRNIEKSSLDLNSTLNVITGSNGSGKTSLLEAIYLLGRGRSFRASIKKRIIKDDKSSLTVYGQTNQESAKAIGLQITDKGFRARINGENIKKTSQLALSLPLLLISPDADKLIQGSPRQRRRFLDWGLFHVEHEYLTCWQKYNRVLTQRNTLLKRKSLVDIESWNIQLINLGETLTNFRISYTNKLRKTFLAYAEYITDDLTLELVYKPGWQEESFRYALHSSQDRDIKTGFTQKGPHRADLEITSKGKRAEEYLSGGQQKLVACALILAQAKVLSETLDQKGLLLVDDLAAELDAHHRKKFLSLLKQLNFQLFVTSTDLELLSLEEFSNYRVFHVEHGSITLINET